MAIFFGNQEILTYPQIMFGSIQVQEVYWGATRIWPAGPIAVDDSYGVIPTNTSFSDNVTTNDYHADGVTAFTVTANTQPLFGTLVGGVVNPDGTFTYTASQINPATYIDTFTYTLTDAGGIQSRPATVSVDVAPTPPIAVDDSFIAPVIPPNATVYTDNVLTNDSDPNGLVPLTVVANTQPNVGTLTGNIVNPDGSFEWTAPDDGEYVVTFDYTVENTGGAQDTATVTINVSLYRPIANNDTYEALPNNTPFSANVTDNDVHMDGVTAFTVDTNTQPGLGNLAGGLVNPDGTFTYTSLDEGSTTFEYTLIDTNGVSSPAPGVVTINVVAQPPNAVDDSVSVDNRSGSVASGNVLTNDSDPQNSALTVISNTDPTFGTLTAGVDANGAFTWTSNGANGAGSFTYDVQNTYGLTSTATVSVSAITSPPPTWENRRGCSTSSGGGACCYSYGCYGPDTSFAGLPVSFTWSQEFRCGPSNIIFGGGSGSGTAIADGQARFDTGCCGGNPSCHQCEPLDNGISHRVTWQLTGTNPDASTTSWGSSTNWGSGCVYPGPC